MDHTDVCLAWFEFYYLENFEHCRSDSIQNTSRNTQHILWALAGFRLEACWCHTLVNHDWLCLHEWVASSFRLGWASWPHTCWSASVTGKFRSYGSVHQHTEIPSISRRYWPCRWDVQCKLCHDKRLTFTWHQVHITFLKNMIACHQMKPMSDVLKNMTSQEKAAFRLLSACSNPWVNYL